MVVGASSPNGSNDDSGRRSGTPGVKDQRTQGLIAPGELATARRRVIITGNDAQQYNVMD